MQLFQLRGANGQARVVRRKQVTEPPPSNRWPATCRHIHAHERRGHMESVVIQVILERVSMHISVRSRIVRVPQVPNCIRQSVTSCSYDRAGSKGRAWTCLVLARLQQQLVAFSNIVVAHMRYANHTLPRPQRCRVVLHSRQRPRRHHDGLSRFSRVLSCVIMASTIFSARDLRKGESRYLGKHICLGLSRAKVGHTGKLG